jgi:NADH dehydrogenase
MPNKIEKTRDTKIFKWQKPFLSNQTGTENAYHPKKNENSRKKKYKSWKV